MTNTFCFEVFSLRYKVTTEEASLLYLRSAEGRHKKLATSTSAPSVCMSAGNVLTSADVVREDYFVVNGDAVSVQRDK